MVGIKTSVYCAPHPVSSRSFCITDRKPVMNLFYNSSRTSFCSEEFLDIKSCMRDLKELEGCGLSGVQRLRDVDGRWEAHRDGEASSAHGCSLFQKR